MGSVERTPMLTPEGSREVEEEMRRPPADTPGRRRMFELMRRAAELLERNPAPEEHVRK